MYLLFADDDGTNDDDDDDVAVAVELQFLTRK